MYLDLYDNRKKIVKKDAFLKFLDVARPLYLEIYASGISLAVRLLQVMINMSWGHNGIPDNTILYLNAFTRKE